MCSVGGGHGVPDADTISAKPRKWITSNRVLATAGPGEQEEARVLSNGPPSPQMTPLSDKVAWLRLWWSAVEKWDQLEFK